MKVVKNETHSREEECRNTFDFDPAIIVYSLQTAISRVQEHGGACPVQYNDNNNNPIIITEMKVPPRLWCSVN